jgi:hypothetical protein
MAGRVTLYRPRVIARDGRSAGVDLESVTDPEPDPEPGPDADADLDQQVSVAGREPESP